MVTSARHLPHGGILYEIESAESARWFEIPANRSKFLTKFGNDVTIKDRTYNIIVENVPVAYNPESPNINADIEKKGGLKQGAIVKAKWIKPIARRIPNQRTAHAIISLKSKESANQILRFGLSIEGKKVYGRKLLTEPTRCLKCHSFDGSHVAAECPQEHDVCGTCGAQHHTSTCKVDDPAFYHCINCNSQSHATWSRDCPTFAAKYENYKKRSDDSKYRFFPMDDPLTWETTLDDSMQSNEQLSSEVRPQPSNTDHGQPPRQERGQRYNQGRRNDAKTQQRNNNPNHIPIGTQSRIPIDWLMKNLPPSNKDATVPNDNTTATTPTPTASPNASMNEPQSTPLWFPSPSRSPTQEQTPAGSAPVSGWD